MSGAAPRILVYAEQRGGKVPRVYREVMNAALTLAQARGGEVAVLWIGKDASSRLGELKSAGPAKIYLAHHPQLEYFLDDVYAALFHRVIQSYQPDVVLGGATMIGRQLLPRVAALCNAAMIPDCVEVRWEENSLTTVRPVYGGVTLSVNRFTGLPAMVSLRPKAVPEKEPVKNETCEIVALPVRDEDCVSSITVYDQVIDSGSTLNLTAADVIVAGGRGLRGPENFKMLEELAGVFGGALGASRSAVDAEWIGYSHQIGQTGKTVCPKLYIACGISGAIQHLVGMRTSDTIVAINKDPEAPIFGVADVGLVGDIFEVVPLLVRRLSGRNHKYGGI